MTKKLTLEIEMLLPTQVTKEVEMPLYLFNNNDNCYIMYIENEEKTFAPFERYEVKIYDEDNIRMWKTNDTLKQFEKVVAVIGEDLQQITKEEYIEAFKAYTNFTINQFNEFSK